MDTHSAWLLQMGTVSVRMAAMILSSASFRPVLMAAVSALIAVVSFLISSVFAWMLLCCYVHLPKQTRLPAAFVLASYASSFR